MLIGVFEDLITVNKANEIFTEIYSMFDRVLVALIIFFFTKSFESHLKWQRKLKSKLFLYFSTKWK